MRIYPGIALSGKLARGIILNLEYANKYEYEKTYNKIIKKTTGEKA